MTNNFNYCDIPEDMLYCRRHSLDDFGVEDPSTLNHYIEKRLFKQFISIVPNYEEFVTALFNTSYYVCTMARCERHPERRFGKYKLKMMKAYPPVSGIAQAMVMLQLWARRWDMGNDGMAQLYKVMENDLRLYNEDVFKDFFYQVTQDFQNSPEKKLISDDEFTPRKITQRVLAESWPEHEWLKRFGTDDRKMLNFITALGKTEEEQMEIVKYMSDVLFAAFQNKQEHDYCFSYLRRAVYDDFHGEEEKAKLNAELEAQNLAELQHEWEFDDMKEKIPRLEAENEKLRSEVEQLKTRLGNVATDEDIRALFADNSHDGPTSASDTVSTTTADNSDARVAELQQQLQEAQATIAQQKALIDDYASRYDPKDVHHKRVAALNGKQHVILYLAVLAQHNSIPNARTNLSLLMSMIAARNEGTMKDYLKEAIKEEECIKLAEIFTETSPKIAEFIRQLPYKLKKDISLKNQAKALKKNNG